VEHVSELLGLPGKHPDPLNRCAERKDDLAAAGRWSCGRFKSASSPDTSGGTTGERFSSSLMNASNGFSVVRVCGVTLNVWSVVMVFLPESGPVNTRARRR